MEVLKEKLKFSSGREIYCYGEKVSLDIGVKGIEWRLFFGSDGTISTLRDPWVDEDYPGEALTDEECLELAEHMIRSWTEYRDALRSNA